METLLPQELIEVILDYCIRDDNDSVFIYHISRLFRDLIAKKILLQQPYPRRLFYNLNFEKLINDRMIKWYLLSSSSYFFDKFLYSVGRYASMETIHNIFLSPSSSRWTNSRILIGASKKGRLDVLQKYLNSETGCFVRDTLFTNLIKENHFEAAKWLRTNHKSNFDDYTLPYAARTGNLEMVKWIIKEGCTATLNVINEASKGGHLDLLKWLYSEGFTDESDSVIHAAARFGHIDIIKWLIDNSLVSNVNLYVSASAAEGGQLQIIKWLNDNSYPLAFDIISHCAGKNGRLDIIEYLNSLGYFPILGLFAALEECHMTIVDWFRHPPLLIPLDFSGCFDLRMSRCFRHSDLRIVTWLIDNDLLTSKEDKMDAINTAASHGHLHIVMFLRERGYFWNIRTLEGAVLYDHLETVQWMWQHDCRGDLERLRRLTKYGQTCSKPNESLQWLEAQPS